MCFALIISKVVGPSDNEYKSDVYRCPLLLQVGEKFRNRSLKFAGLISGCTMDWFSRWPRDALIAVSSHFLGKYNIVCTDESKVQLVETMGTIHDNVAENCQSYFQRLVKHVNTRSFPAT